MSDVGVSSGAGVGSGVGISVGPGNQRSLRLYFGVTEDRIHGPWTELAKLTDKKDLEDG